MLDQTLLGAAATTRGADRRAVHRAIAELRRGTPVLMQGEAPLIVWSAETSGAASFAEAAPLCAGPPALVLAVTRASDLIGPIEPGEAAVALAADELLDPALLLGLADPAAARLASHKLQRVPTPPAAATALRLLKLARLLPAAVVAPAAPAAADAAHDLLQVSAAAVQHHADSSARSLRIVAEARVPLEAAPDARLVAFRADDGGIEHVAIVIGDPKSVPSGSAAPLVRVHSECFTGDLLGSLRCDCGQQLASALHRIGREGVGAVLYLAQEGRGIGLPSKLRAYALQDRGLDTVDANRALGWQAEERDFLVAATMLTQLGIGRIRLLTNNPAKLAALTAFGIEVTGRVPLVAEPNGVDDFYLATKARRFGHLL